MSPVVFIEHTNNSDTSDALSVEARILVEKYKSYLLAKKIKPGTSLVIHRPLGSIAVVYERIRNAIDYKGEHLLRRGAIERILRRLLWERPAADTKTITQLLVRELVWAKYLTSKKVTTENLESAASVLNHYFQLLEVSTIDRRKILGMASAHIEEILDPSLFYIDALVDAMFGWFKENFEWEETDLTTTQKDIHLYMAIHRGLFKSDYARVRYHVVKRFVTDPSPQEFFDSIEKIDDYLDSPIQIRLYRFVRKYTPAFRILKEVMERNKKEIDHVFGDKGLLEERVREVCAIRYEEIGKSVRTGIIRSIIYIFITKILVVLLIEVPYEIFTRGSVSYMPILINVATPPTLMFLVGLTIKKPSDKNTQKIIESVKSFIYKRSEKTKTYFNLAVKQNKSLSYKLFIFAYTSLFLLTFGGIAYILRLLNFNFASMGIFFMFLSLVLLFGFRVRFSATELNVGDKKEGLLSRMVTNLSLPLLNLGVWLSKGLAKINFVIILMDFLIEAPLKNILSVLDNWNKFIREKRDEVIDVPTEV